MLTVLVVLVRKLVDNGLPLLKKFGRCRDEIFWNVSLTSLRITSCVLCDHVSDVARLKMLLDDWKAVEHAQHALNDLDWRVAAIWIPCQPHLEEPATVILQKDFLHMLSVQKLGNFLDHLEPVHGSLSSLDCLVVAQADCVHFLNQIDREGPAILIEGLFRVDCSAKLVGQLTSSAEFGVRLLASKSGQELCSVVLEFGLLAKIGIVFDARLECLKPFSLLVSLSDVLASLLWRRVIVTVINIQDDPLLVRKLDVAVGDPCCLAVDAAGEV